MNQDVMQQLVTEVKRLQRRVGYLERLEKPTVTPIDYFASSTVVGWTSFTRQVLVYSKIGRLVFVRFDIIGTSNATTTTFTLPFALAAGTYFINTAMRVQDNGGATQAGFITITGGSNLATAFFDFAGTGWTASGTKRIVGEFFYMT